MPSSFVVWENQAITVPGGITPGVPTPILTSQEYTNASAPKRGLRLNMVYNSLTPNQNDGGPGGCTYELGVLVEGKSADSIWFPIGYQFSGSNRTDQAPQRQIVIDPNVVDFNAGIEDVCFIGVELSRISRQQGFVPPTAFRVKLMLTERNPGGAGLSRAAT